MSRGVRNFEVVIVRPHVLRLSIGSGGASHLRRLILLRSVGWRPPDGCPSGACLTRGTRVPGGLVTPSRGAPHRGCASAERSWDPGRVVPEGVTGTCLAMAQIKPASARAMATTTGWAGCPRAMSRRSRVPRRTGAFQRRAWMTSGGWARRRGRGRRTWAGSRSAQAPSTSARRAGVLPALVREPCRRRSPLEDAQGLSPKHFSTGLGVSTRVRSPSSATVVTATMTRTPRRAWRASTTGGKRQVWTGAVSSCARRWRRAVWAVPARTESWKTMCWAGVGQTTALRPRRWAGPQVARPV
jgi:hypothetical protein